MFFITNAIDYTDQFPPDEVVGDVFYRVGVFLEEMAKYEGAAKVLTKAKYYYEISSQNLDIAKSDYAIARCLM